MPEAKPKPAYDAFVVEGDGEAAFWTKIGAAWPHDDAKGFNIQLAAIPLSGRIALRIPKPKEPKPDKKDKK